MHKTKRPTHSALSGESGVFSTHSFTIRWELEKRQVRSCFSRLLLRSTAATQTPPPLSASARLPSFPLSLLQNSPLRRPDAPHSRRGSTVVFSASFSLFQRVIANFSLSGRVQHTAVRPSGSVNVSELTGPLQGPSTKSEQRRVRKRSARTESSEL